MGVSLTVGDLTVHVNEVENKPVISFENASEEDDQNADIVFADGDSITDWDDKTTLNNTGGVKKANIKIKKGS
jgi:hypothetical protein